MGLETGFLKYIIKTPITVVGFISMYIFGGVILTFLNTISNIFSGNIIDAFLEYFIYSAIPPISLEHVFFQVIVGTLVAGFNWYIAMVKLRGWNIIVKKIEKYNRKVKFTDGDYGTFSDATRFRLVNLRSPEINQSGGSKAKKVTYGMVGRK